MLTFLFLSICLNLFLLVKISHIKSIKEKREVQEETVQVREEVEQRSDEDIRMDYFNYRLKKLLISRFPELITFRYQDGGCPYVRQSFCVYITFNDGKEERTVIESKDVWGGRLEDELPMQKEKASEDDCFTGWLKANAGEIQRRMTSATKAGFERINYEVDLNTLPEGKTLEELAKILSDNLDYDVKVVDENELSIIDLDA